MEITENGQTTTTSELDRAKQNLLIRTRREPQLIWISIAMYIVVVEVKLRPGIAQFLSLKFFIPIETRPVLNVLVLPWLVNKGKCIVYVI